jgi:hypothetical protein
MLQLFDLATENAALRHEVERAQEEAESLRFLLEVVLQSRVETTQFQVPDA